MTSRGVKRLTPFAFAATSFVGGAKGGLQPGEESVRALLGGASTALINRSESLGRRVAVLMPAPVAMLSLRSRGGFWPDDSGQKKAPRGTGQVLLGNSTNRRVIAPLPRPSDLTSGHAICSYRRMTWL
jgi:hypothetical protein